MRCKEEGREEEVGAAIEALADAMPPGGEVPIVVICHGVFQTAGG